VYPFLAEQVVPVSYFRSPTGKVYRIRLSQEPPEQHERVAVIPPTARPVAPDDFNGHDRMASKTSIAEGPQKDYNSLADLLDELNQNFPDSMMLAKDPPISKDADSKRLPEENHNVSVTAWLYAAKKESDHDFHLIIGTDPMGGNIRYMNSEISGLPLSGPDRAKLRVPRQAFKDYLQTNGITLTSQYLRFEDPIPVRITGSLFYDIDHEPGVVGSFSPPPPRAPASSWEIHPITKIELEPPGQP
jgi:hypothetical protein